MQKGLTSVLTLACAMGVFAQGTVQFNNRITGVLTAPVYLANGQLVAGPGYSAAILAANGAGVPSSSLTFGVNPTVTTFRTGTAAGLFAAVTATLNQVPPDAPFATLQIFAWDNLGGSMMDPAVALNAWWARTLTVGGLSDTFTVANLGGNLYPAPDLAGLTSFYLSPEPGTLALLGLWGAGLLVRRRPAK